MGDFTEGRVTRGLARQEALEEDAKKWRALLDGSLSDSDQTDVIRALGAALLKKGPLGYGVELSRDDGPVVRIEVTPAERAKAKAEKRSAAAKKAAETRARRRGNVIVVGRSR